MIELFPPLAASLTACIAIYTDLKRRTIPNRLTLPALAAGLAFYGALGFHGRDPWPLLQSLVGAGLAFGLGYALWLMGGWAGGDVKLFTAFGALLPFYKAPAVQAPYPFPLTILLNSIVLVAPFLLVYTIVSCAQRPKLLKRMVRPSPRWVSKCLEASWVILGCSFAGLGLELWLGLPWPLGWLLTLLLLVGAYLAAPRVRLAVVSPLCVLSLLLDPLSGARTLVLVFIVLLALRFLLSIVSVANREIFQEEVPIRELKEGAIPAETIFERRGRVYRRLGGGFLGIFPPKLKASDHVLADPRVAAGVTQEQVRALQRLVKAGKLEDKIRVKKGIPFAPALGAGLFLSILFGDIYWFFILKLAGL